MAYDVNKLLQLSHLKSLAEKNCAKQTDLTKLSEKVIIATGGEANKLEGVKVNGLLGGKPFGC